MPFLAPIGIALGASAGAAAGVGALAVGGTALAAGSIISSSVQSGKQASASKNAAQDAIQQQNAAVAELQTSQNIASTQAQNALDAKRKAVGSNTDIFTSPLGLTTQATTAKKTLLGA